MEKIKKKLSSKNDTTGITKLFMDKVINIPAVQTVILKLLNMSFVSGLVPNNLKVARVVPIPKVDGAKEPSQFRPISLTSNLLLLLERIYYDKLVEFLGVHNILSTMQFGCRKNHSTELAMVAVSDIAKKYIDKGFFAVVVSIDLRKAFNSVHKETFLMKMENKYNISNFWIRDYLTNREQFVDVCGNYSSVRSVLIGLPAGSVLAPILFALYLNDLPQVITKGTTVMFVDDSNFVFCGRYDKLTETQDLINSEMVKVVEYFNENSLVINSDKTKMLTLSTGRKVSKLDAFSFNIQGFTVLNETKLKCLGLTLDRSLSWRSHIDNISKLCYIRIRAIYTIRDYLVLDQLKFICQSYVYSMVNYMISVYGMTCSTHLKLITKIVRTLARLVLQVKKFDPVAQRMYNELEWLLPTELCEYKSLCLMYKIIDNPDKTFFSDYFKKAVSFRRVNDYAFSLKVGTNVGKSSFEARMVTLWNKLPSDLKCAASYNIFKIKLKLLMLTKMKIE